MDIGIDIDRDRDMYGFLPLGLQLAAVLNTHWLVLGGKQ
jgi:hypothetical protein